MYASMKQYGLDALSVEDRLQLIEELWASIVQSPEILPMSEAQQDDLDRRLREYRDNPTSGSPWTQALDRLRNA